MVAPCRLGSEIIRKIKVKLGRIWGDFIAPGGGLQDSALLTTDYTDCTDFLWLGIWRTTRWEKVHPFNARHLVRRDR